MYKWDSLSRPERAKLLAGAGLPTGLAQLNWSGLQKSERKKLEKGKGWFEAKEPIMTDRGIEHKAPEHHRVAIKKEAGKANNKPMERKEPIASKKAHQPETSQGIKLDSDEEKFVRGIYKQISEGATVKEFGTRLYIWRGDEAYATKHITDSEYTALKAIIKGVHQVSRADALKNLQAEREKEAKIVHEIEERKEQEAGMTPSKLKDKMSELNKVHNNFRQKYGRSGVKKETQRQALADFERMGREIADDMAKQLGFNNLGEVPDFGLRNKLRGLYDPNTFMEDTDRFLKQIEIKVKEAKLPVKGMAGQGI